MVTLVPPKRPMQDTGHQIIEMLNADRTLRIEMAASAKFKPSENGGDFNRNHGDFHGILLEIHYQPEWG